jgi:Concanavalin A-like lectin/glucanases superfamily
MKRATVALFLVVVAMGALPGIARAAVISTWPLATNANDTTDGNNGAVQNVVFDGSDAAFNGTNTRVTVPFAANLVPGSADVTTSVEINTTHQPGTGNLDFDLIRSEPTKNMYKVELFPHGKIKAQAQCIFHGSQANINVHAGPSLNDGQWHTIVCHKTATQVTLTVDGILAGTAAVTVGSITFKPNAVFAIGYKPVPGGTDADFYNGLMRNVSVAIG